jgi:superfamily II DNA or RNA helicase
VSIAEATSVCVGCGFPSDDLDEDGCCPQCAGDVIADDAEASAPSNISLRDYQTACVEQTYEALKDSDTTLIVKATGLGKTVTCGEIIRRWENGRILFMAHRDELIRQACRKIHQMTGEECDVEMGEQRADSSVMYHRSKVVVTSVQTMSRKRRMARFNPEDFGLMVVDEAHHCISPSYLAVVEHFRKNRSLKLLGLTATPDRADERAMGQLFETVAFEYGIVDGINDGWLVPIEQQFVQIAGLDLSRVKTTAGDLNKGELAKIMEEEERCQEVASATRQLAEGPTLVFTASVRQAELIAQILNRHEPGSAEWICGDAIKCPIDMRRSILRRFSEGAFQYLVNCAILLEGYDEPTIRTIVMARPTKSRSLYAQVIGRGTRALPGVIEGKADADARRAAIAESGKTGVLVLDLAGNSGRHKLITTADILGGNYDDDVVAQAVESAQTASRRNERVNMLDTIRQAVEQKKEQERRRREKIVADAKVRTKIVDPFAIFDILAPREREFGKGRPPAPWAKRILDKAKIPYERMSYEQTAELAKQQIERWQKNLCTFKQAATLRKFGFDGSKRTFEEASSIIDRIAKSGWKLRGTDFETPVAVSNDVPF